MDNPGHDVLLVAHNQDSSNNLMRYIKGLSLWMCKAPDAPVKIGNIDRAAAISFTNLSEIKAIPGGNPDAILSHGGSVLMDEFAFHRDQYRNYANADPVTVQHEGVLRITTTPFSDTDLAWDIFDDPEEKWEDWTRHHTTMVDAIGDGLLTRKGNPIDLEYLRRGMPDEDEFNAAYMGVPLSSRDSYLGDLIPQARKKYVDGWKGGDAYGGFDVARVGRGDIAAMAEVRRQDERHQAEPIIWAKRGVEFPVMQDKAVEFFRERKWVRMAIDANGIGLETSQRITKRLGTARVDSCMMSSQDKATMMTTLRDLMEHGNFALPDDRDLLLDLKSIKRIVTDSANIRYDAERNDRGHADRAWALALAVRAAGSRGTPAVTPTASGSRTWGGSWGGMFGDRSGF